jgi:hypothetical protein
MDDTILKRFDTPDEVREFDKGRFELLHIGGMTIGRATYAGLSYLESCGAWAGAWIRFRPHQRPER